uniref:Putative secreted protein n=1 Tax=Xenopsylla cheopis TaxID=163159 RepID=A0A6M2DW97_XENCH
MLVLKHWLWPVYEILGWQLCNCAFFLVTLICNVLPNLPSFRQHNNLTFINFLVFIIKILNEVPSSLFNFYHQGVKIETKSNQAV